MAIQRFFPLLAGMMLLAACGQSVGAKGHDVGAVCSTDRDCANRCSHDGDFGFGMCTRPCATDRDCPSGAVCITTDNGMCAVSCQSINNCTDFGRGFICGNKSSPTGGSVLVCRLP